ncbi:unnamed protein product [Angiostrongylus costaricensis]|uniref:C2H2-type domain-containing protein n=1 Tax=Angiostrongylus costaricensis TaxID=334426 RepID=A0A0R3PQR8_ANGCS|nr:unnamed protein product [Angiostrongylus costaricensis]
MERVYNPQAIDLNKVGFPLDIPGSEDVVLNVVPSLSEICLAVLSPKRIPNKFRLDLHQQVHHQLKPGSWRYRPSRRTGQLCTICRRLFPVFLDYEDHLRNGNCASEEPPDPIPIHMSDSGNIPLNYGFNSIAQVAKKSRLMICSLCHDDRFSSSKQFHEHIINCGRKLAVL